MKRAIILVITAMAAVGCGSKTKGIQAPGPDTNSVTLIVNLPPAEISGAQEINAYVHGSSLLSYMNPDKLPVFLNDSAAKDTLRLPASDGYLEIAVFHSGLQYSYFYLKGGDTVTVSFHDSGYPKALSSLSPDLTRQYNFAAGIEGAYNEYGVAPDGMCKAMIYNSAASQAYAGFLANYKKALSDAAESGTLDPAYLDYYVYRYAAEQNKFINSTAIPADMKKQYEPLVPNDSLAGFISYYNGPVAALTGGGRKYDDVAADRSVPPQSKKLILYYCLRLWNTPGYFYMSDKEIELHYEKFLAATGDAKTLEYLKAEFRSLRDVSDDTSASDLALYDIGGNETTLEEVIAKHAGKVVYVDFWASWCGPCVGSMPAALRLRKKYADRGVVFVYLGYKDAEDDWRQAITKYEVDLLAENYLILNPGSGFLEQMHLNVIPRYMVFDKKRQLVNANAPGPQGEDIKTLLDGLLQE